MKELFDIYTLLSNLT